MDPYVNPWEIQSGRKQAQIYTFMVFDKSMQLV